MNFDFVALNRASTVDTVWIKFISLTNTDVTFTFNGQVKTIEDWEEIGTDRDIDQGSFLRVCYYSRIEISGLPARTRFNWTATQGSITHTGATNTKAAVGNTRKTIQLFATCLGLGEGSDGVFEQYQEAVLANPVAVQGLFFQDDTGYFDSKFVQDLDKTGIEATRRPDTSSLGAPNELTVYNYAAAMAAFNFLTFDQSPSGIVFLWLCQNIPFHAVLGDHELVNNYHWKPDADDDFEFQNHDVKFYKACRPAWDAFYGDCMPPPLLNGTFDLEQVINTDNEADVDSTGPHNYLSYGLAFGQVRMVQMDGTSHACYNTTYASNNDYDVQVYDPTDLTAAQDFLNQSTKFKQFWISNSFKDVVSAGSTVGAKDSWGDHSLTGGGPEWLTQQRAFASFVSGADELNGTDGNLVILTGNDHDAQIIRHNLDEGDDFSTPFVYGLNAGSLHAGNHSAAPIGGGFTGTYVQWTNEAEQNITRYSAGMIITVEGDSQKVDIVNGFGDTPKSIINFTNSNNWQDTDMADAIYIGEHPLPTNETDGSSPEQSGRAHSLRFSKAGDVPEGYKLTEIGYRIIGDGNETIDAGAVTTIGVYTSNGAGLPLTRITEQFNPEYTQVSGDYQDIVFPVNVDPGHVGTQEFTVCTMGVLGANYSHVKVDDTGLCSRDGTLVGVLPTSWEQASTQSFSLAMYAKFEEIEALPITPDFLEAPLFTFTANN